MRRRDRRPPSSSRRRGRRAPARLHAEPAGVAGGLSCVTDDGPAEPRLSGLARQWRSGVIHLGRRRASCGGSPTSRLRIAARRDAPDVQCPAIPFSRTPRRSARSVSPRASRCARIHRRHAEHVGATVRRALSIIFADVGSLGKPTAIPPRDALAADRVAKLEASHADPERDQVERARAAERRRGEPRARAREDFAPHADRRDVPRAPRKSPVLKSEPSRYARISSGAGSSPRPYGGRRRRRRSCRRPSPAGRAVRRRRRG